MLKQNYFIDPRKSVVISRSQIMNILKLIKCLKMMVLSDVFCVNEDDKHKCVSSRRCYDFLDLLLQEWQTHSLER